MKYNYLNEVIAESKEAMFAYKLATRTTLIQEVLKLGQSRDKLVENLERRIEISHFDD